MVDPQPRSTQENLQEVKEPARARSRSASPETQPSHTADDETATRRMSEKYYSAKSSPRPESTKTRQSSPPAQSGVTVNEDHENRDSGSTSWGPCRIAFWAVAIFSLVVLGVIIAAAVGDDWIRGDDEELFEILMDCDLSIVSDDWCQYYEDFRIVQISATVVSAFAVLALMVAAFVARADLMGYLAGLLFLLYVLLQATACFLGRRLKNSFIDELPEGLAAVIEDDRYDLLSLEDDVDFGDTFYVAAVGGFLGLVESFALLGLAHAAKAGPFWAVLRNKHASEDRDVPIDRDDTSCTKAQ